MINPDVIYKVDVASSNLDIIAIIISAFGVLFSAVLSGILLWQTSKNNIKNSENEIRIAEYQQKVTLFDKRLSLYQTLFNIDNMLSTFITKLESETPPQYWFDYFKIEVGEWMKLLNINGLISEFVFNPEIAQDLKEIKKNVITIDYILRLFDIKISGPVKPSETEKSEYATVAAQGCLTQLEIIQKIFKDTNILENIKPFLQIKI